jgi:hypothetical protein
MIDKKVLTGLLAAFGALKYGDAKCGAGKCGSGKCGTK